FEQAYPREIREAYWEKVQRSLEQIFHRPGSLAQVHRRDVAGAPLSEQIMVYHQEPIEVAADLAGVSEITPEQQRQYIEICEGTEPSQPGWPDTP
ncbi:MAG: hypothetical protein WB710_12260, partial [Stellaceae bacterium]